MTRKEEHAKLPTGLIQRFPAGRHVFDGDYNQIVVYPAYRENYASFPTPVDTDADPANCIPQES